MENEETIPTHGEPQPLSEQAMETDSSTDKTSKKALLLATLAVVIVAIIAAAIVLLCKGGFSTSSGTNAESGLIYAKMTDDGTAYIPLFDGTSIVINEEVKLAALTKDRKHIVVFLDDGTLYVTDKKLSGKNVIANNCSAIGSIRDDGFFYTDKKDSSYRVLYSDYSVTLLGENVQYAPARNNTTVLYATDDGDIYTMLNDSTEKVKVGTYNNFIELEAISNDGNVSVWVDSNGNAQTIILNDGDDKTKLGTVDTKYNYTYANFSKSQKSMVIQNLYSEEIWIKAVDSEPITVKLGATPYNSAVYTKNGLLTNDSSGSITEFYISTDSDSGTNVYYISMNGDRERVLSKILNYEIANNIIFYIDEDNALYYAELNGPEIYKEIKVSNDVDMFELTDNGKYIYYTKDYDDGLANLYCYKIGADSPVKIASDISCYNIGYAWGMLQTTYSTDGATVFFFKDEERITDTYYSYGTLMKWHYGSDSAEKIASEVLLNSISGTLDSGEVEPTSFMYMKYNSIDKSKNILANWMYYNGKESAKVVTDVII